jgi:predicted phage terminase large subunit-like protein
VELKSDQNVKGFYENTAKGFRLAIAVGGRATGFRGDAIVVDDPLNAKDAHSEAALNEHVYWFDRVLSTRLNDPRAGAKVVIMQRLHERDLAGHLLEQGGWEHLCLPSELELERRSATCLGWQDPRTQPGELLFPELFPTTVLDELKHSLANDYAGQHQQRPAPADGGIFKSWWWRFWYYPTHEPPPVTVRLPDGGFHNCVQAPLPEILHQLIQSWDMAFKDTKASAYVVGQTWGLKDANAFLLDQIRDKLDITASLDAVRTLSAKWPKASAKLIEDKANGPAVIRMLRDEIPGILEVQPDGGKEARANSVAPYIRSGNVYLPHPGVCPWVNALLDEATTFPNSRYADQVDALSQALINLFQSGGSLTLRKMVTL